MSIFNNIKYPISDTPSLYQLQSVPRHIFEKWRRKICFPCTYGPKEIHSTIEGSIKFGEDWKQLHLRRDWSSDINLLRTMITRMRK